MFSGPKSFRETFLSFKLGLVLISQWMLDKKLDWKYRSSSENFQKKRECMDHVGVCYIIWQFCHNLSLRKHAYTNIVKILPSKKMKILIKILIFFHISAQNIDYGYSLEPPQRGGSNEYPQSMFLSRNKKNNAYPRKPQFYYIKVGFKGVKIIQACFRDGCFFILI